MRKVPVFRHSRFHFYFHFSQCFGLGPGEKKKKKTAFTKGQSALQLGVGIGSFLQPQTDTLLYFGTVKRKAFPPLQLRYEYAVTDNIGIGGMLGFASSKVTFTDNTDPENINGFKYTFILAGARASFHLKTKSPKFDPYLVGFAGLNLTTILLSPKQPTGNAEENFPLVGSRWRELLFTNHLGAFSKWAMVFGAECGSGF